MRMYIFFIVSFLFPSIAFSDEYPRYQGVYLQMKGGSFVEVPAVTDISRQLFVGERRSIGHLPVEPIAAALRPNTYSNIPEVAAGDIDGIIINLRNYNKIFVDEIVSLSDRYSNKLESHNLNELQVYTHGDSRRDLERELGLRAYDNRRNSAYIYREWNSLVLVLNSCGLNESRFRAEFVSDTLTRLEVDDGQLTRSKTNAAGDCGRGSPSIDILGFSITIDGTVYPFLNEGGSLAILGPMPID